MSVTRGVRLMVGKGERERDELSVTRGVRLMVGKGEREG